MNQIQEIDDALPARIPMTFRQPEQAIRYNALDPMILNRVADQAPAIDESVERTARAARMGGEVVERILLDTFNAFHKNNPTPSGQGSPLVREVAKNIAESDQYPGLHAAIVGDEAASAMCAASFTETFTEKLAEEIKRRAAEQEQAERDARDRQAMADQLAADDAPADQVDDAQDDAARAGSRLMKATAALKDAIERNQPSVMAATDAAAAKAGETADQYQAACKFFGTQDAAIGANVPPHERIRLAKLVASQGKAFRKLLDLIGRLSNEVVSKKASRDRHDSGEIVEVGIGGDPSALLDDEIAMMAPGSALRLAKLAQFVDDSLMIHEVEAKEVLAKGDMVLLIDASGSMNATAPSSDGQRYTVGDQARGIAIALAQQALRQRRTAHVLFFGTRVCREFTITPAESATLDAQGRNPAADKVLSIATIGSSESGTDFDAPLIRAAELVEAGKADRADIVFITDGESAISPEVADRVNAIRKAKGLSLFTLLCGGSARGATPVVEPVSDRVWWADNLLSSASELFDLI